jgi:hypothetical protein
MKDKLQTAKQTTTTTYSNVVEFVQAVSLVVVAAYSGYAVKQGKVHGAGAYILAIAAAVIAVRGMFELLKHFNKK